MGLIKASLNAAFTAVGDQFKEVVTCPSTDQKGVIIQRGVVSHGSGNKVYSEGVISNGSKIIVPQGMAMMIIDDGKVVEFSADPGDFIWDTSTEPSIFTGKLGKSLLDTIKTIGQRIKNSANLILRNLNIFLVFSSISFDSFLFSSFISNIVFSDNEKYFIIKSKRRDNIVEYII